MDSLITHVSIIKDSRQFSKVEYDLGVVVPLKYKSLLLNFIISLSLAILASRTLICPINGLMIKG